MPGHDSAACRGSQAAIPKGESPFTTDGLKNDLPERTSSSSPSSSSLPPIAPTPTDEATMPNPSEEETCAGDIVVTQEPGQPPKLARSTFCEVVPRAPRLFAHLPDRTREALTSFEKIEVSWYANKYMGYTEHAMECDCAEEWDPEVGKNLACGDDSDCINRATKIECVGDCGCGPDCRNQRFQKKQYAKVSVIKTDKKGYGLRAETNLEPHQLIFEYVGEVVGEAQFRRRMRQYDTEGIKHFYFMSLNKGEFVDATKRGNLGRFCNHSCNPNCYVDKWVVGEKLRMGIFAERAIQAGEELVFNYNVDRYGADPQPCYCGEPNCTGFIGGRTQTERATKLSHATIEALGIEDADSWDTVVSRRPKKKKTGEDDEEYVDSVEAKSLDEDGVTKVMAALMQCQEKWIAVKLLGRIQRCEDERVRNRVVKMHGYQILNSQLAMWKDDHNVMLQVLDILDKFPRLTRNKIIDSKIETNIQPLTSCGDERVEKKADALLASWANLEVGYRIPRMKRSGEQVKQSVNQFERREFGRMERQRSPTRSPPSSNNNSPHKWSRPRRQRNRHHQHQHQHPRPRRITVEEHEALFKQWRQEVAEEEPLPQDWYEGRALDGRIYYYSDDGDISWDRPWCWDPKRTSQERRVLLQGIIDKVMNSTEKTPSDKKAQSPDAPQPSSDQQKNDDAWWKKLSLEKQKKIYEKTLFPHVKYMVDRYKHKIPKEDLKRFAKEIATKLVESDYKKQRVSDPTHLHEKHQKAVRQHCKEFFDKAAEKHKKRQQQLKLKEQKSSGTPVDDPDVKMSDEPVPPGTATSPGSDDAAASLKRKRDGDSLDVPNGDDGDSSPFKRQKSTPPPAPPPPPVEPAADNESKLENDDDDFSPPSASAFPNGNGTMEMEMMQH